MPQIRVHGQRESGEARRSRLESGPLTKSLLTVKHSVQVGFARDGQEPAVLHGVADDDLVELELDGGLRLWSSPAHLRTDFGMKATRGPSGGDMLEITPQLPLGGQSRGVGDWIIRGLKVLGVDVAGQISDFVGDKVEGQLTPGPGLYRCSPTTRGDLQPARKLDGSKPTLVFLHGTGSSTDGSFGELWSGSAARIGQLAGVYGANIVALQHRTLTQSPVENARDLLVALARILPARSELHLVSHSRGGLVGELVARGNRVGGGSFDQTDLQILQQNGRSDDLAALKELRDLLDRQRYVVSRFVRVASPTRGTTLASGRLDTYLSVILNVLSTIPGLSESALFDTFSSLLAAVVKKRTDPQELPGLEAMMPESALVQLVNRPDIRTDANLRILGGDVEGTGFFGRLKAFVTDLYYREDHDLVVNTPSMFGGIERSKTVRYWVDTGGRVNHFNYFANADTANRLVDALTDEAAPHFHDVTLPLGAITEDDYRKRAPMPQPVVFVLPGTMGSTLTAEGRRVWLDRLDLARGGMALIKSGAAKVLPESLVSDSYAKLVRHLAASHEVVPFPYDWRLPLAESATALRKALDAKLDALEGTDQPIRIVAHSMGGLVVRAMLGTAEGQATWTRMCAHPGARLVMLGTPNGGSHAIGAMLMGRDSLVRQLALLDLRHDYAEILAIIAEFDGALQLLPHAGTLDLYDVATWQRLHLHDAKRDRGLFGSKVNDPSKAANVAWTVPSAARLARARASRDVLRASRVEADRMIYVAGVAEQTPTDIVVDEQAPEGRRVTVMATSRGDGRVPWATGIPEELAKQTYYMNAVHGDLASTEEAFPALVDLLSNGTTSKLPKTPPAVRGAIEEPFPLRELPVEAFPDDASLAAAAVGGRRGRKTRRGAATIRVSVVHDNLVWARWPVLVGHYQEDVLVGAEDYLDRQLNGRLRELQRLDLYPGPYNTATVVLNEITAGTTAPHPGAIVTGLGPVGELTPGALTATLTHGLTLYGAQAVGIERRRRGEGLSQSDAPELQLGVVALLVGGGAGGVTLADSIQAILRAVHGANGKLMAARDGAGDDAARRASSGHIGARISTLHILELYEDRAIQAVRQLRQFSLASEFRGDFVFDDVITPGLDGEQRVTFDESPGWWQRLRIAHDERTGDLRFEALTDRARAEASLLPTQQLMVQGLLERASRSTATDLALSATLFELLVPRTLKEQAPDRRQLVLLVDDTSAMLPWELLHDRWNGDARPLSVDAGMVRQFVTPIFRERVQRATGNTALVIGDPPLDQSPVFQQLPGAAAEARAVAAALRAGKYETTELVDNPDAAWPNVLSALYNNPYRILHIAAHGVHDFVPVKGGKPVTGVVLGKDAFLTPDMFEQLRVVPDLVFINCCHLAAGGAYGRADDVAFWRFAPNVAFQLIRMGVRAVVAAGWAVDDQAAKAFAERFYAAMLAGQEFGQAVLQARREIYAEFGAVNTWGAYQCYGDPGFSLTPQQRVDDDRTFVAERELCAAVLGLRTRVRTAKKAQKAELERRLDDIVRLAAGPWLTSGVTCAAIARAYATLGNFAKAMKYYEAVLVAEPASASIEDIEQLANLMSRGAAGEAKPSKASLAVMQRSTELLQHLAGLGATVERQALLGGTAKRLAVRASGAARIRALKDMIKAYDGGHALAVKAKRSNAWYPLSNAVAGKIALSWLPGASKAMGAGIGDDMKALRGYAKQVASSADFWELVLPADVRLLEAVASGQLSASERKAIEAAYRAAGVRAGTPREVASATGQIEFLRDMARASARKPIRQLAESLEALRKALAHDGS